MSLYYRDAGAARDAPGLVMVTQLKREHVYLSSFSKMRVDLAAQVCILYIECTWRLFLLGSE